jgi:hypothetical protein
MSFVSERRMVTAQETGNEFFHRTNYHVPVGLKSLADMDRSVLDAMRRPPLSRVLVMVGTGKFYSNGLDLSVAQPEQGQDDAYIARLCRNGGMSPRAPGAGTGDGRWRHERVCRRPLVAARPKSGSVGVPFAMSSRSWA